MPTRAGSSVSCLDPHPSRPCAQSCCCRQSWLDRSLDRPWWTPRLHRGNQRQLQPKRWLSRNAANSRAAPTILPGRAALSTRSRKWRCQARKMRYGSAFPARLESLAIRFHSTPDTSVDGGSGIVPRRCLGAAIIKPRPGLLGSERRLRAAIVWIAPIADSRKRRLSSAKRHDRARPAGAATPANRSTKIYWFAGSAAAAAMYFDWR